MGGRRGVWLILLLAVVVTIVVVIRVRGGRAAPAGPLLARCPGPDRYGYTCQGAAGFSYLDATRDQRLWEDDGLVTIALPFPLTFYGTQYHRLQASSNGTLQLTGGPAAFDNECLVTGPAPQMGDMAAPYWDDLDMRFAGSLDTELVGEPPDRIFVIEWDGVPRFGGDLADTVTFEVQLLEATSDILFLYQDVTTVSGSRGGGATIGLQSVRRGIGLQFSCNQPAVAGASGIRFVHPAPADAAVPAAEGEPAGAGAGAGVVKEPVATLLAALAAGRNDVMVTLQRQWLRERPARQTAWQEVDLTGDGRNELVVIWQGGSSQPHLSQVAVVGRNRAGALRLWLDQSLSTRVAALAAPILLKRVDLTGDGVADVLVGDAASDQLRVLTAASGAPALFGVAAPCAGRPRLADSNDDGVTDLVWPDCADGTKARRWNGRAFVAR